MSLYEAAQGLLTWDAYLPVLPEIPITPRPDDHAPLTEIPRGKVDHPILGEFGIPQSVRLDFAVTYVETGTFAGRITFPLMEDDGRIVGFCGRTIHEGVEPKYLISKGCRVGQLLYNLNRTVGDSVVLVEGPRDVWALSELGLPVVSTLGAHLTVAQLKKVRRFDTVAVFFDGDEAGRTGTETAYERLEDGGVPNIIGIRTPEGEDPASLAARTPALVMRLLLEAGFPLVSS